MNTIRVLLLAIFASLMTSALSSAQEVSIEDALETSIQEECQTYWEIFTQWKCLVAHLKKITEDTEHQDDISPRERFLEDVCDLL